MKARRGWRKKNELNTGKRINRNSHCFDDMTEEMGVTKAFLFTNLAILLSAKAITMRNSRTFSVCCLIRFRAEYQLKNVFRLVSTKLRTRSSLFSQLDQHHVVYRRHIRTYTPAKVKAFEREKKLGMGIIESARTILNAMEHQGRSKNA